MRSRPYNYVSFSECEDEPRFYKTKKSLYDQLTVNRGDPKHEKKLNKHCFLSGEDYVDIFQRVKSDWVGVCRYLIYLATESEQAAQALLDSSLGKTLEELEIPVPSREPEDLFTVDYASLAAVYRYRLMLEASMKCPSVYSDLDDIEKREKAILEKLKAACASEEAYKVWKKDVIDAKVDEVMEKQNIVVCSYMFIGVGKYEEIMPEEMVPCFKDWIDHNGSAFFGGSRPATKWEVRTYIAQHIADDLFEIVSPIK